MMDQRTKTSLLLRPMGAFWAVACAFLTSAMAIGPESARADFRLCNNTTSRVGIAIGYKENDGWATEDWWNLSEGSCETPLKAPLVSRFYYTYAGICDH